MAALVALATGGLKAPADVGGIPSHVGGTAGALHLRSICSIRPLLRHPGRIIGARKPQGRAGAAYRARLCLYVAPMRCHSRMGAKVAHNRERIPRAFWVPSKPRRHWVAQQRDVSVLVKCYFVSKQETVRIFHIIIGFKPVYSKILQFYRKFCLLKSEPIIMATVTKAEMASILKVSRPTISRYLGQGARNSPMAD